MRKKIINIVSVIIIILGLIFIYQQYKKSKESPFEFETIKAGTVINSVSATGTIKSPTVFDLEFENSGKINQINARVGDKITKDQILAKTDDENLKIQLRETQAGVLIAQARLNQIQAQALPEDIKIYETAVLNAQNNLEKTKSNIQADVDFAKVQINSAEVSLNNAKENLKNIETKAENDLNQDYQSAGNTLDNSYIKIDTILLKDLKYIKEKYFAGSDQVSIKIQNLEQKARDYFLGNPGYNFIGAYDYYLTAKNNPTRENIDVALQQLKITCEKVNDALDYTVTALYDVYNSSTTDKSLMDNGRTNIASVLSGITGAQQAISSQKIINQTNIDSAKSQVSSAEASLNTSKQNLISVQVKGDAQIMQLEGQVKTAQDQLMFKKASPRQADIEVAQAQVQQAQIAVEKIQSQIQKTELKAPSDGIITRINSEVGEMSKMNQPFINLISQTNYDIEAEVSESDIGRIKIDDPVEITFDAFPYEKPVYGKITKIDPAETVIQGIVYYKITATFENSSEKIKSGMTANLIITTDKIENVLIAPQRALISKDGKDYVRISNPENQKAYILKQIMVGLRGSEGMVEIKQGLKDEDKIITYIKK